MSRDNTKRSRGFIYQRQYAIYYFLNNCNSFIIEEGTINNKVYEDITIKHNDNKLVTYQIKHHNKPESLSKKSNFYKTLNNINNIECDEIYYITLKGIQNVYIEWNNVTGEEKYNMIDLLDKSVYNELGHDNFIKYINKIKFYKGLEYSELIDNINEKICNIFNVNDNFLIFNIRFKIVELFENKFMLSDNNEFINISDEIMKIKNELNTNVLLFNDNDKNNIINNYIKTIFISIKNIIDEYINYYYEIESFQKLNTDYLSITHILKIMILIKYLYHKEDENNKENIKKIKKYHNKICKLFCNKIIIYIMNNNNDNLRNNINNIPKTINYYYNHKIKKKFNFNNNFIKYLLGNNEFKEIKILQKYLFNDSLN